MPIPPISTLPILYHHLHRINPKDEHAVNIALAYDGWSKAIEAGNESLAAFYVEEYSQIDMLEYRWNNGDSALHVAVKNKKPRLISFLLDQGAPVNDQNIRDLSTPLHYAVLNKDEKIVDLLIKWDADPKVTNRAKQSPITIASGYRYKYKHKEIYRLLVAPQRIKFNESAAEEHDRKSRKSIASRLAAFHYDVMTDGSIDGDLDSDIDDDEYWKLQGMAAGGSIEMNHQTQPAKFALRATHIAQTNPFSKLERKTTISARKTVIHNLHQKPLPKLTAWLQKKIPKGVVAKYHKRWVIVKGVHLLWSAKQRWIMNDADRNERKKFNGSIHLRTIDEIKGVDTTANDKFMVKAQDERKGTKREYVFKCINQRERDYWVQGLKEHKRQCQMVRNYLGK